MASDRGRHVIIDMRRVWRIKWRAGDKATDRYNMGPIHLSSGSHCSILLGKQPFDASVIKRHQ
jgi:hypothetical protein